MTWVLPALLTLLLGSIGINRQAWRDEHATWQAATIPLSELGGYLAQKDIVIAPYYLLMRGWIALFGDSVVAMRLPSLLAMAACAGLVGLLGERLFGKWIGIVAGTLFAVLPSVSRYAAEARPYPFAIAFAVAGVYFVLRRRWWLVCVTVAFAGLSHLIALLVLLAHIPLLTKSLLPKWGLSVGIGLLPVIPLAVLGIRQTGQVSWIDSGWRSLGTLPMSLIRSAVVAGILAALAGVAVLATRWDRRIAALVTWIAAPPVVLFLAAQEVFYYRYLLFTVPAWVLLAALAVPRRVAAVPALLTLVLLLGARDHLAVRRSPLPGDQDYRAAAAYVGERFTPEDRILFDGHRDRRERHGFAYELRRRPAPQECVACLQTATRLWLVTDGQPVPVPGFVVAETKTFPGISLALLVRSR